MSESVNGVDVFVTKIVGTDTQLIRETGLTDVEAAFLTTHETAAGSVAGSQVVDFGGTALTGNATGLVDDTTEYTATINIDGTDNAVLVVGNAAQTFGDLITQINADLPGTEAALDGDDNITVTSSTTGNDSVVLITDVDLFSTLTGFVAVDAAVDGDLQTVIGGETFATTGQTGWEHFAGYVESYDTALMLFY